MSATLLHEWVSRRAERLSEARALVHRDAVLTYGALERLSSQVAWALHGVGCRRGDRVALLLPRSPMTIAAIIGILKADCIYVPLDAGSPGVRLAKLVERCEPRVLLASPATEGRLHDLIRAPGPGGEVRLGWIGQGAPSPPDGGDSTQAAAGWSRALEAPAFTLADIERLTTHAPATSNRPDSPAYILFTSGSTGTPKGVVITHRNVTSFIQWAVRFFELGARDRIGGYTELTFDLSTFDIYATFASGAELHMVPEEDKLLPPKIVDFMRQSKLTHWLSVPSFLEQAVRFDSLRDRDLPAMKWVTWCGDVFPTPALLHWMERLPHASFANLYGPTETTVASSVYAVPRNRVDRKSPVPIGRPCEGEELEVLDDELHPVPDGEVGHLFIRGVGLSPGYWRDPEQTRAAFLPDPRSPDPAARIYRTGDLARRDEEGNVHFLGREDQQIKTRGFRVELGEVESALRSLPEISDCAVVGYTANRTPGKLMGCIYVPSNGGSVSAHRLRERLARFLPTYMIPVRWKVVDRVPLNDRGKVDRIRIREWMEEQPCD